MEQIDYIELETDWRREKWPDGFIGDCCNQNCKNKGCVVREHLSVLEDIAKRAALFSPDDILDDVGDDYVDDYSEEEEVLEYANVMEGYDPELDDFEEYY
ncbi:hypothetical protein PG984_015302 [Apiospora sp. TS-2023a]